MLNLDDVGSHFFSIDLEIQRRHLAGTNRAERRGDSRKASPWVCRMDYIRPVKGRTICIVRFVSPLTGLEIATNADPGRRFALPWADL